ncbi:MAG TPA: hypothetical protein VFS21_07340 [Roseiflexaceae bacterium]|nr:hypothetical protein [Roseiflexaceae bacterium]
MRLKNISWELFFLAFAILFTIFLALANVLQLYTRIGIPVPLTLLLSLVAALVIAKQRGKTES